MQKYLKYSYISIISQKNHSIFIVVLVLYFDEHISDFSNDFYVGIFCDEDS